MNGRATLRAGLCALAALAAGCVGTGADKSGPLALFPGKPAARGQSAPPSPVVPASADKPPATPDPVTPAGGAPAPIPTPVPPTPVPPNPNPLPGAATPPLPLGAQVMPPGWTGPALPPTTYSTTRGAPTAAGSLLGLAPGEAGAERVIELARLLEAASVENRALMGRIRDLDAAAVGREQAIAETMRDVEAATNEVTRARADIQALRREIATLKERMEQADKDDVETLKAVIAALERILDGPPALPAPKVKLP